MTTDWQQTLQAAAQHISKHDQVLAPIIQHVGPCRIQPHTNYYRELVESIISQQLSIKAADTILKRFVDLFGGEFPAPEQIATKDIDQLRSVGMSRAKAIYVRDSARHILDGQLEITKLPALTNDQIITELTAVKGIGEWTAHMFLMFSLGRLDVLAVGDLGIRSGIMRLYSLPVLPSPAEVEQVATTNHWHPFETIACWYIWRSLDNIPKR